MKIANYTFIIFTFLAVLIILLEIMHKITVESWKNKIEGSPDHWKLGVFYYNREDTRVIVPKPVPWMGWTLNMAQPVSSIFLVAMALIIILSKIL